MQELFGRKTLMTNKTAIFGRNRTSKIEIEWCIINFSISTRRHFYYNTVWQIPRQTHEKKKTKRINCIITFPDFITLFLHRRFSVAATWNIKFHQRPFTKRSKYGEIKLDISRIVSYCPARLKRSIDHFRFCWKSLAVALQMRQTRRQMMQSLAMENAIKIITVA